MMRRALLAPVLLAGIFAFTAPAADTKADSAKAKKALMEVGEFIGGWNLTGETKTTGKLTSWKEVATWSWKFKGDDSWINIEIKDGRFFTKGELKYLTAKKLYELTATDNDGKSQVYTGDFKKGKLALERKDEKTSDIQRLSFVTLSEGVRMAMQYETQAGGNGGRTLAKYRRALRVDRRFIGSGNRTRSMNAPAAIAQPSPACGWTRPRPYARASSARLAAGCKPNRKGTLL